ncbi:amidohydrolase family protein, partial [Virgibacillus halodenitrificans]|nr:amidohydrolase family protein [Virgibacillus halodenitrificans]
KLIDEIVKLKLPTYDNLTFTTDGATPGFYEHGLINICIEIAIEHGIPVEDAYRMASYNAAVHYNMEEQLGSISPGRIAHINILQVKDNPHPTGVLAKGKWVVKDGFTQEQKQLIDWEKYGLKSLELDWEMDENELQFSVPVGLDLVNDVIIKPYAIETDITLEEIPSDK